ADLFQMYDLAYFGPDLHAALPHVDAVVICTPNYLHYSIARACLEQSKHILCEKPVTTTVEDCENLLQMANSNALIFTVGHVRRFYPAVKRIKDIVAENAFGRLIDFDFREGTVFSWPTVSGYIFNKEKAGGGVLMDIGVHLLDLLLWWLDDEPVAVDYADDALGGLEAFVDINMTFSKGVTGRVRLSRLSVLRNSYSLRFERGEVQWSPFNPGSLYIRKEQKKPQILSFRNENPTLAMLSDFSAAVGSKRKPLVTLEEALRSLKVIHHCYRTRKSLALDWLIKERGHDDLIR
ncbi:MAG: Gfo/Idh/MocA family oxidoreductase, partial [Proteobacteria bacterium]|nr:Gfo/Idh/MocA family oxidoreductase [Pseudomonadota bacterium]